ncbi:cytochrome P450 [Haloglomus irregulare]|jgi:cytochrome P450|nr:cytochrome P450 [Haloglomus irregulare]
MARELPTPPEAGLVNALRFGTQTFRFLEGVQSRFEDAVSIPVAGGGSLVLVTNPSLVHDALSRPEDFPRVPAQGPSSMISEQGLVQSEGDLWRQQREVMGDAFAGPAVRSYGDTVGRRVEELTDEWRTALSGGDGPTTAADGGTAAAPTGGRRADPVSGELSLNLHREMTSMTFRVACEAILGETVGRGLADRFYEWMAVAGEEFEFDATTAAPEWLPTPVSAEFDDAANGVLTLAETMIERRRRQLADGTHDSMDMLTLLLLREDDPEVDYPPNQIRDEVATFLIAGHETTALSLSYTQSLLAWHPEIRARVREEVREVVGDETPAYEHYADLEYTGQVYAEALRLYPPAWAVFRRTTEPVELGDYRVPADAGVIMPQWSIHRDERYFDRPDEFDPSRWDDRRPEAVEAYFPFSVGPHACIGRQFALTGARMALAGIVREFDVDVPAHGLDDLRATPTLRPGDGVPSTVRFAE